MKEVACPYCATVTHYNEFGRAYCDYCDTDLEDPTHDRDGIHDTVEKPKESTEPEKEKSSFLDRIACQHGKTQSERMAEALHDSGERPCRSKPRKSKNNKRGNR